MGKAIKVLTLLAVLASMTVLAIPVSGVQATTWPLMTIYGDAQDAVWWRHSDVSYADARDAATADVFYTGDNLIAGQDFDLSGTWDVQRGSVVIDTSYVPDGATILSATIYLHGSGSSRDTAFSIILTSGMPSYPTSGTPLSSDYNRTLYGTTNLGYTTSGSWSNYGYNAITLNTQGIAAINKTGLTKLLVRTSHDIDGQLFTYDNWVMWSSANSSYPPYIEILYTTPSKPYVATGAADGISKSSATLHGSLVDMGDDTVCYVRFNYGTANGNLSSHTAWQTKTSAGTTFSAGLTGLDSGTTYYYQAEGNNTSGESGYGYVESFDTDIANTAPTVTTSDADSETNSGARLIGYLSDDGGSTCSVWFQWGTTDSYTGGATVAQTGYSTGAYFYGTLEGLSPGTLYHFRAVASNEIDIDYGSDATLLTRPNNPTGFVVTSGQGNNSMTWNSATGASRYIIRRSTTQYPATTSDGTLVGNTTGTSLTDSSVSNGTTYYYTIWSWTSSGALSQYSSSSAMVGGLGTPYATGAPSVTVGTATGVDTDSATLHGQVTGMGGYASVSAWFQYRTLGGSWTDNETGNNTVYSVPYSIGASISSLSASTTYYFRVAAVNGNGTVVYSGNSSFTTGGLSAPVLTVSSASSVTKNSATMNGVITSDGGATVTAYVEWGNSISYGLRSSTVSGLETDDPIVFAVDGLSPSTTYHYRIAGWNGYGGSSSSNPSYSSDGNFTTSDPAIPSVTTRAVSTPGSSSITISGYLEDDGGANCEMQFEWYAEGGSWDSATATGWQTGKTSGDTATTTLSGLVIGQTYYVRAEAKNSAGTGYGETRSFTTAFTAPTGFDATATTSVAIKLTWTVQGDQTLIMGSTISYPGNYSTGTKVYFGTSNSYTLTGLAPGTSYYFSAWSWLNNGTYSVTYATAMATTGAAPIVPADEEDTSNPDAPGGWFAAPDYTRMKNMPLYDQVNAFSDALSMPYGSFWFLVICVLGGILLGTITYIIVGRSLLTGAIVMDAWYMTCFMFGIAPLWFPALMLVAVLAITYYRRGDAF